MWVTTFYAFKGGVGRTTALINVAVDLAQRGRRVLIVDFDLEAPGLDTFGLGLSPRTSRGIVEYVVDYLAMDHAPDLERYLSEANGIGDSGGKLWMMPAGRRSTSYAATLGRINWKDLYAQHDGFLLFENLKQQWRQVVNPDHVLLDCSAGYTDAGGICTRQLPDTVFVFLVPDAQNSQGLKKIVTDIRKENNSSNSSRYRYIDLRFVVSNVPYMDDEERVFDVHIDQYQEHLGFTTYDTISRYDSFDFLQQKIFVNSRPRSRVARDYRSISHSFFGYEGEDQSDL